MEAFEKAYQSLNPEQKRAVETIEGPVMVVAGPGTGKTQVLALRIAHILRATDTPPDGVLCLTFTNAGVQAMRERLSRYIGAAATRVRIATFHAFAMEVVEEWYEVLGTKVPPTLLEDAATVALFDEILQANEWKQLRPRANPSMYYKDIKSLIGVLKRERITPADFRTQIEEESARLSNDPTSISSRGETKGKLKKEVEAKLQSLARSLEVADFYEQYESLKGERSLIDYADVLELLVRVVEESEDARDTLRERFLYVLVDEHQDSTGIQNEFLEKVWKGVEQPNLFVVGDDRQLIYGFGGASLAYFEGFKHLFGTATLITLTRNYRSTQTVLDAAEALLSSTLAEGKLVATNDGAHPLRLIACEYPRDEILRAGIDIQEKIQSGVDPNEMAILVPKNYQAKAAIELLRSIGIPVAAATSLKLFELVDTQRFLAVLAVAANPYDIVALSRTVLDPLSGIPSVSGHAFLAHAYTRSLSLSDLEGAPYPEIVELAAKLSAWVDLATRVDAYELIQTIGTELFLTDVTDDEKVRSRVEIIRTLLHLALSQAEKAGRVAIKDYLSFIQRLKEYGEDIPLAVFGAQQGVKVLTLHGSKGLEFESVWIAHMDERSLMSSRRQAFALPETIGMLLQEESEDVAKRQLYVAMTRAKKYLTISYASLSYTGKDQQLASIIFELPETLFTKESQEESEKAILTHSPTTYVARKAAETIDQEIMVKELVKNEYDKKKLSVTMLNNFFECPWKWYFRNLLCLPEVLTDSLHIGNIVHETIEHVLRGGEEIEKELMRVALIETRGDEHKAHRYMREAFPIVTRWQDTYQSSISGSYEVERSLSYRDPEFAHLTITGKIDLLEHLSDASVRVTDWKTGTPKTNADIDKTDEEGRMSPYLRQLAMYSYLLSGTSKGNTVVQEARLVFLEAKDGDKNSIQARSIGRLQRELLHKDIQDYDELLKSGQWMHRPCRVKTYNGEVCEYCALAERFGVVNKD